MGVLWLFQLSSSQSLVSERVCTCPHIHGGQSYDTPTELRKSSGLSNAKGDAVGDLGDLRTCGLCSVLEERVNAHLRRRINSAAFGSCGLVRTVISSFG